MFLSFLISSLASASVMPLITSSYFTDLTSTWFGVTETALQFSCNSLSRSLHSFTVKLLEGSSQSIILSHFWCSAGVCSWTSFIHSSPRWACSLKHPQLTITFGQRHPMFCFCFFSRKVSLNAQIIIVFVWILRSLPRCSGVATGQE